jgi:hypothetical protein
VRAAALRNGRHSKREQSDCGAELHETILRPIELLFLGRQTGRFPARDPSRWVGSPVVP